MDLTNYSQEIRNYIADAEVSRRRNGWLDYDTCQGILEYAAETNSDALFGMGYYFFAEHYWWQDDVERTMHCLTESTKCLSNAKMYDYLARAYNMMGAISENKGSRLVALSYFHISLQYAECGKGAYEQAMANSNIAYILVRMKHFKEAEEHYHRAAALYEEAEETIYRGKNLTECIIQCGFCHLILGEISEALELWDRVEAILQQKPEHMCSVFFLQVFEAGCEGARGNQERAMELLDSLEQRVLREECLAQIEDLMVIIGELFDRSGSHRRLERLIQVVDQKDVKEGSPLYLDMYPYKSRYLLQKGMIEEYMAYTGRYLGLYRQHMEESKAVTAQILELQDELRRMEIEQRDIRAYNQRLEKIALYDPMTSLPNRAYLNEYVSQKFEEAQTKRIPFGVELLDIDYFKEYNDTYGHLTGDVCIEAVAGILKKIQNDNVFCARYGGDEFMIVYCNMTVREVRETAESIQGSVRALEIPYGVSERSTGITVSQGIFMRVPDKENREWDFESMADTVLYQAKREGRNCYRICTDFL